MGKSIIKKFLQKTLAALIFFISALNGEEDCSSIVAHCHEYLRAQQKKSEEFLENISHDDGVEEILPKMLYIKKIKLGNGASAIKKGDQPTLLLQIYEVKPEEEELSWEIKTPKKINLEFCIPGIQEGVLGMTPGEKRRIYMHPLLMQGEFGPLRPYNFIIYDIEIISNP